MNLISIIISPHISYNHRVSSKINSPFYTPQNITVYNWVWTTYCTSFLVWLCHHMWSCLPMQSAKRYMYNLQNIWDQHVQQQHHHKTTTHNNNIKKGGNPRSHSQWPVQHLQYLNKLSPIEPFIQRHWIAAKPPIIVYIIVK